MPPVANVVRRFMLRRFQEVNFLSSILRNQAKKLYQNDISSYTKIESLNVRD